MEVIISGKAALEAVPAEVPAQTWKLGIRRPGSRRELDELFAAHPKVVVYLWAAWSEDSKAVKFELQYELDKVHGEQIKHNNETWRTKAVRLRDAGAFRIPRPRDTWERIDAPKKLEVRFSMFRGHFWR